MVSRAWQNQTGYGIADLELQNMAMGWSETTNLFKVRNVWHDVEFYVTDNWRITPRLTVDYGFRWSFLRNPYLSDDRYTVFNPAAFDPSLGRPHATACSILRDCQRILAPRAQAAWPVQTVR